VIGRLLGALLLAAALPTAGFGAEATVRFPSIDGDLTGGAPTALTGLMITPEGPGPFPAIVLAHGCNGLHRTDGTAVNASYLWWGRRFAEAGYVALLPDSFGPRGKAQICTVAANDRGISPNRERARDMQAARIYLAGLATVAADRIGLMGWSNGGTTVLASVSAGAPGRPETLNFKAAVAFYPGCLGQLRDTTWSPAVPTLILGGLADDWTPVVHCQNLVDRLKDSAIPLTIHSYPDAHHAFDALNVPLRVRTGLNTRSGTATIGTNVEAREDSIKRTLAYFQAALTP